MRGALLAASLLGGALASVSCVLELDRSIACGDGLVDGRSGEECDPGDERSAEEACGGQPDAVCNPVTCQAECCGDRVLNGDEECDGPELGFVGPSGDPSNSDTCRSQRVPGFEIYFERGSVGCTDECRLDLSECSLCGNGQQDNVELDSVTLHEICDGDSVPDLDAWSSVCGPLCGQPTDSGIGCNVACEGCQLLIAQTPLQCCVQPGRAKSGLLYPCCCEFDPLGCAEFPLSPEPGTDPTCPNYARIESS